MAPFAIAKLSPLARIALFIGGLVVIWLPLALPLYWLSGQGFLPGGDLAPTALLYILFLILVPRWGRYVHGIRQPWAWLGITGGFKLLQTWGIGLGIGAFSIVLLVGTQVLLGWASLRPMAEFGAGLLGIVLGGALTAMAVGWAEEILFRGWLLRELERGFSLRAALVINSGIFALAHFIKPPSVMLRLLPQLLGLLLLGAVLVWARRIPVRLPGGDLWTTLGYPVGLHTGLVWGYYIVNVSQLIQPTGAVPTWVTGVEGNPLAGMLGLVLLAGLAVTMWALSRRLPKGEIRP